MKTPGVSVVTRTLNEKDGLSRTLHTSEEQDFPDEKEVIVVDNESTDGTAKYARAQGARALTISHEEFSYPKFLNVGVSAAQAWVVF